eukprot:TRINITY_DN3883_c0_g2_i1.p1 TRINITY_DN3883_c0_g2~~TRINITY_DN3883_c0_g2_i1.p1  ORF type:complete len:769 (-),score=174.26 TRINITY_DN3883_c0_g2_i1:172-2478(-)
MQIKRNVLGTLASAYKNARKGAAQAVSSIACIEIPRGEWPDIINILIANASGMILEHKLASLETLGYIFEELPESSLSEPQVDLVLSALVSNLLPHVEPGELKLSALTVLTSCIKFCEKNFKERAERNTIMSNVLGCCSVSSQNIRTKAMQCILEIVHCFYDYIGGNILESIANTTFNNIRNDEAEEVVLIALEVWCSICEEEVERMKDASKKCGNYVRIACDSLMKLLLETISRRSSNDETQHFMNEHDNSWNIPIASTCCISLIALIIEDQIIDYVRAYISANIGSASWQLRNAAILSFISILKGPQKHIINSLITQALDVLISLLRDPSPHVRETTAWSFERILNTNPEPILSPEALKKVLSALVASLKDVPRVSSQTCFALHNLAKAAKPRAASNSGALSVYFKDLLSALWENAFRSDGVEDGVNLGSSSFVAFSSVVQYSAPDVELSLDAALQMLVEEFAASLQPSYRMAQRAAEYQEHLCSAIQPSLIKLSNKILPAFAGNVAQLIVESFKFRKTVYDEGIIVISALVTALGAEFASYMELFGPYLVYALKSVEDVGLCRVAAGCVGDLARALGENMARYLGEVVPILMDQLRNSETERGLKLVIIIALSDLAMTTNKHFLPFLKDMLEILKSACDLSLSPLVDDDPDLPSYMQSLRESIIDAYVGIAYGLSVAKDTSIMDPYIAELFRYMQSLYKDDISQKLLSAVVGLVGDLASLYKGRVKDLLSQIFVQRMIGMLEKVNDEECRSTASWAKAMVAKALK